DRPGRAPDPQARFPHPAARFHAGTIDRPPRRLPGGHGDGAGVRRRVAAPFDPHGIRYEPRDRRARWALCGRLPRIQAGHGDDEGAVTTRAIATTSTKRLATESTENTKGSLATESTENTKGSLATESTENTKGSLATECTKNTKTLVISVFLVALISVPSVAAQQETIAEI